MARAPVETIERRARLQPQAAPVDTYVRPAAPARSPLWDVAEGLAQLDADLAGWLGEKEAKQKEADALRGRAAFLKNNRQGFGEGVRSGKIPAYASPAFKSGYKVAEGDYMGQKFSNDLELAYEAWEGKDSGDPAAFDAFAQEFLNSTLASNDGDFLRGALPGVSAALEKKRQQHNAYVADSTYKQGLRAHIGATTSAMQTMAEEGLGNPEGTDYDAMWEDILKRRQAAFESGVRYGDYDQELVKAIVSQAVETRDPGMLALLEKTLPGGPATIANDPAFREIVNNAEDNLMQVAIAAEERGYKQAEAERKQRLNDITAATIEEIAKDPSRAIPEDVLVEGSRLDPKFRLDMLSAQKAMADGIPENPKIINDVMVSIMEGGGEKAVMDALKRGYITDPKTFEQMLQFAKSRSEPRAKSYLDSDSSKRIKAAIKTRTRPPDINFEDPWGTQVNEAELAATMDFERAMIDWQVRNPDASEIEKLEATNKIGKLVLDAIGPDQQYNDPTPGDNPFSAAPAPAPTAAPAPAAEGAEAAPAVPDFEATRALIAEAQDAATPQPLSMGPQGGAQDASMPELRSLPEGTRTALEQRAANLGINPEVLWDRTWRMLDGPQRRLFGPSPQVQYLEGSNMGNAILDVIGAAEAPQGYDTVSGFATSQPPVAITEMTLDELAAYQQQLRSEGARSTAMGRYQIMGYTLPDIMAGLGLDGSETFTPELQDRMAMWLLERRGLQDFLDGRLTIEQFADNLAQEWAGLPTSGGQSYHEGDGLNKATIGRSELMEALQALLGNQ
jgi:hypothetical protein